MKKRFLEIDMLRGIAIIAMILIHTCYYFLNDKTALFIWNWSQFAVPVFIFCAAYLFFQKPQSISLSYLKKRLIRLIKPYHIFLLFFIPILFFVSPEKINFKYILQSIFAVGGVDINWLVLLFIFMTIIFPLIGDGFKKYKPLFIAYSIFALISSITFVFLKFPFSYKFIFWLPWSVIPIFTYFFVLWEHKKYLTVYSTFISGLIFAFSYYLEIISKHNLGMYENKYPPTIYFLSYGIFMISLIYLLSKLLIRNKILTKAISFFSLYSYSIYFIHYMILIILASQLIYFHSWIYFFLSILISTIAIQLGINKLEKHSSILD